MPDLLVIVPSRGRPHAIPELLTAFKDTSADADLLVAVDDDDPHLEAYRALDVWLDVAPRTYVGPTLDRLAAAHAGDYQAVGFMGDDHRPRTPFWDTNLTFAATGGDVPGIAYGNDLIHGINLPTAVVMDSRIPKALGRITPTGCLHLFLDNYWRDLGGELGTLYYLSDVVIEHLHPIAHKSDWDDTYREANAGEAWTRDQTAYNRFFDTGGITMDATLIRAYGGN